MYEALSEWVYIAMQRGLGINWTYAATYDELDAHLKMCVLKRGSRR